MLLFHSFRNLFSLLTDYSIACIAATTEGSVLLEHLSTAAVGSCFRSGALNLSRVLAGSSTDFFGGLSSGCSQTQGQQQLQFNLKHVILICNICILVRHSGCDVHTGGFYWEVKAADPESIQNLCLILKIML